MRCLGLACVLVLAGGCVSIPTVSEEYGGVAREPFGPEYTLAIHAQYVDPTHKFFDREWLEYGTQLQDAFSELAKTLLPADPIQISKNEVDEKRGQQELINLPATGLVRQIAEEREYDGILVIMYDVPPRRINDSPLEETVRMTMVLRSIRSGTVLLFSQYNHYTCRSSGGGCRDFALDAALADFEQKFVRRRNETQNID